MADGLVCGSAPPSCCPWPPCSRSACTAPRSSSTTPRHRHLPLRHPPPRPRPRVRRRPPILLRRPLGPNLPERPRRRGSAQEPWRRRGRARWGPPPSSARPRVLNVAARRGAWLGVVTDEQPNGRLAWVKAKDPGLRGSRTSWSLHADLSERSVELRRGGQTVKRLSVAVGTSSLAHPARALRRDRQDQRLPLRRLLRLLHPGPHRPPDRIRRPAGPAATASRSTAPTRLSTIGNAASAGCLRAADADLEVLMRLGPARRAGHRPRLADTGFRGPHSGYPRTATPV